jgi:hypothetical protein
MSKMDMFVLILFATLFVEMLICVYALFRNSWIYKNREALIGTPHYDKLPSYSEMMDGDKCWCWNFEKYYKE